MLEIRTLGGLSLRVNGQAIKDLGSRKAEALLVYLAVEGGQHNRNMLATLLWPESTAQHTLTSLRVALSLLRKNLGSYLEVSRDTLGIKPDTDVYLDLFDLDEKLVSGQMEQALEIYRGDFLQGFHIRDSLEFEDWCHWEQERLHRMVVSALHSSISNAMILGDFKKGQVLIYQLLELDPLDELAHQQCMMLLALDGQRTAALAQYQKCRDILQEELGVEPSEETQGLYELISKGEPLTGKQPLLPRHNLPTPQTSFIGRQKELLQIGDLIDDPACRLLTLVGPGGIGKTSLALQAATKELRSFSDGTYFVPLEAVSSPAYLISTIAGALRLNIDTFHTTLGPKYQLLDYLRNRSVLLVMDSFEHLIDGAGLLSEILNYAPNVKMLVTSRERLHLRGEWTFPVEGLPVPLDPNNPDPDDSSALKLFAERAQQAKTDLQLSDSDREYAIRICQLMEGMPLGIELAAAWTHALTPKEIAEEIQKDLDFLSTAARDLPERHRSLRAVFDSSWRLLTSEQRDILCKLSVFRGGFDRQSALLVADASLLQLSMLMDKSLLARNDLGRFFMHELIRQYAAEKPNESLDALEDVHNRHCQYYIEFLSQRETDLMSPRMMTARDDIRGEMENVRTAVKWAVIHWKRGAARRLLTGLLIFYVVHGWHEGEDAFREIARARRDWLPATNSPDVLKDPVYLSARIHQAFLHSNLGQIDESEPISRECLEPLRGSGLRGELSECLHNLGLNASFRGEYQRAREYLEEAILLGRESHHVIWPTYLLWLGHVYFLLGEYECGLVSFQKCYEIFNARENRWGTGFALSKMGLAADGLGEHAQAMQYHREALSLFEKNGDRAGEAYTLSRMSMSAYFLQDYTQAVEFGLAGYELFHEIGHRWGMSTSLCRLGFAYLGSGDRVKAKACFNDALERSRKNQMAPLILYALAGLASSLAQEGEIKKAVELFHYVGRHPQTPALYVEAAARWFVHLNHTSARDRSAVVLEDVEMDEVIDRLFNDEDATQTYH